MWPAMPLFPNRALMQRLVRACRDYYAANLVAECGSFKMAGEGSDIPVMGRAGSEEKSRFISEMRVSKRDSGKIRNEENGELATVVVQATGYMG